VSPNTERFHYLVGLERSGDNWLALRSEPSGQRGIRLMKMGPDTLLTVLGREGEWLNVRLRSGETGWAHSKYIACCRDAASPRAAGAAEVGQCVVSDPSGTPLNVRDSPNGNLTGVRLNNGTAVQIASISADARGQSWALVTVKDDAGRQRSLGFVFKDYVRCEGPRR
jgi:hypothetical protein